MALALKDRVKETTIVVGTGSATLLGSSIGFQPFSVVGNGNTTYYCISDQFGSNWEVGIGTYSSSGNTLARTTVLASSNGGALVVFTAGVKDVFVTYPAEKGVWLDASNNAIGLGTPAAFVGTNITGTASGLTAGNVTTNANLTGAVISSGNATSLGSFTSLQLATALTDETGSGSAVFATSPTLANPTYTGTLTGSTGILNIGSGQIYKDASGNVGIGTSSPTQRLTVIGSSQTIYFGSATRGILSQDSSGRTQFIAVNPAVTAFHPLTIDALDTVFATSSTERMRIDSSGNVGIGTSSPTVKLNVIGTGLFGTNGGNSTYFNPFTATTSSVQAHSSGANSGSVVATEYSASGGAGPGFYAGRSASGTLGTQTACPSGMQLGSFGAYGSDGTKFLQCAYISAIAQSSFTTNNGATYLSFGTNGGSASVTERMRIDSAGNVGIGTSSPICKLNVYSSTAQNDTYGFVQIENPTAAAGVNVSYTAKNYSGTSQFMQWENNGLRIGSRIVTNTGLGNIVFTTGNDVERMRIDSSGNLLVGTTSGSYKITCNGQPGANGYTAWTNYSDQRLKENITDFNGGLKEVLKLKPKSFNYNELSGYNEETRARTVSGFIAQELELICPEMVGTTKINDVEYLDTNTSNLNLLLVKAIQELKAIIDTQQEQINSLLGK